jgi:hypothetical protein
MLQAAVVGRKGHYIDRTFFVRQNVIALRRVKSILLAAAVPLPAIFARDNAFLLLKNTSQTDIGAAPALDSLLNVF